MTPDAAHMSYLEPHREAFALRAGNEPLARLMDAGKFLFAQLAEKNRETRLLRIDVQILCGSCRYGAACGKRKLTC